MTKEQKHIKIAEACRWTRINESGGCPIGFDPQLVRAGQHAVNCVQRLPNYFHDLNAMHEAEKMLDAGQWDDYQQHLREQVRGKGAHPRDISSSHASATQRAEAFGRVKGLW